MSDDARKVLSDPRAPASERFDAQAELGRAYRPTTSGLIPAAGIQPVIDLIRDGLEDGAEMMKAAQIIPFPAQGQDQRRPGKRGGKSIFVDTLGIMVSGEYYEKPSPLGFDSLRQMNAQTPILASIVLTRQRQLSRFCQPSEDGGQGFEVRHVDRKHQLTEEERANAALLTRFFQNCGWEFNPRRRKALKRTSFKQFMMQHYADSLIMDASPIETEMKRNRSLGIDGFYAIDGATIRLCTDEGYQGDDSIIALQLLEGRIATTYTIDQIIYEVRNPRSDVHTAGYGMGETELLVRVVTGILNAMSYNIQGFDQNAIPKGILHMYGDYDREDTVAFKRYWNSMVKGINNRWSLPVMISKDKESGVGFEQFGNDFNEMHFAKWMTFLTSIACAVHGMSPEEINFESFAAQKSSLSGADTEEKLTSSRDTGLHPDMAHFEAEMTDFICTEFAESLCFRWVGLRQEDAKWDQEAKKLILTVDELRAEEGYEPHPDPEVGALPVNPSLIGPVMQLKQMAQQPQQDFGTVSPGADQGGDDEDPGMGDPNAAGQGPPEEEQPQAQEDFGGQQQGDFGKALAGLPDIYSLGGR